MPKIESDMLEDDTIRSDFQRTGVRQGNLRGTMSFSTWLRYGAYDTILQAVLGGTWTTNVLKTGGTRRSFVIEEYFSDLGVGENPFHRFDGCEFSKLSLQIANNQLVATNFDGLCRNVTRAAAIVAGATYGAASTNEALAFKDAAFTVDGVAIGTITSLSLAIDRQLQPRYVANSGVSLQPDSRIVRVNGSVEVWLDTGTGALIDAYLAETEKALGITLTDPASNAIALAVPALKLTSGMPDTRGDTSIPVMLNFEAYYDSVAASQLTVTRTPHA
jgi:hypothetical protein